MHGRVRIGIGGWTYAPWRGTFFPDGLPHSQELAFAAGKLTSIEINGTYYRTQTPATFSKWHDETPDDFVFALKAPRYVTNRRVLAEAGPWQFMPGKKYEPEDFAAFLRLLPDRIDGRRIRHAVEVRHESFATPAFVDLARDHGVAIVVDGDSRYPVISDVTASFVYVRIMGTTADEAAGYSDTALDRWATPPSATRSRSMPARRNSTAAS